MDTLPSHHLWLDKFYHVDDGSSSCSTLFNHGVLVDEPVLGLDHRILSIRGEDHISRGFRYLDLFLRCSSHRSLSELR